MNNSWDWKTFVTSLAGWIQHFAEHGGTRHNKMHFIAVGNKKRKKRKEEKKAPITPERN